MSVFRVGVVALVVVFTLVSAVSGLPNPAAVYCEEMGYQWIKESTSDGEVGVCLFPDGSRCDAWGFYEGKCGIEWNYCTKNGWKTKVAGAGMSAVCVDDNGTEVVVSNAIGLRKFSVSAPLMHPTPPRNLYSTSGLVSILTVIDYGYDSNFDGKFDYLILDVQISVTNPGAYLIYSQLEGNTGIIAEAANVSFLDTGNHWVRLRFSGDDIMNSLYSGSFVASIGVYDPVTYMNYAWRTHTTNTYSYTQFLVSYPQSFDWRNVNGVDYITPPKDQGSCGACWAFASVGAVEAKYNIVVTPHLNLDLSEQELISCCSYCGFGCGGGDPTFALTYTEKEGVASESCFPYVEADVACTLCPNPHKTRISSFEWVMDDSPAFIKRLIADYGPVIASVNLDSYYWDNGVMRCTSESAPNHAVLVVGYSDTGGYWILKNSWGTNWGDNGFFKLGYGECNITFEAYVTAIGSKPSVYRKIIYVPDNYTKIQWAINNATVGDTIIVRSGTYYENVIVNKPVSLYGLDTGGGKPAIVGNNSSHVVTVSADGVIIDGFMIGSIGAGYADVYLMSDNNILLNNSIFQNSYGVYLENSSNNSIVNNIFANDTVAVFVVNSTDNKILDNNISYNNYGVYLHYAFYCNISGNYMSDNNFGIVLSASSSNRVTSNEFIRNGILVTTFGNIIENNTVNGRELLYLENCSNIVIKNRSIGQLILAGCSDVIIRNLEIFGADIALELFRTNNSSIISNSLSNNTIAFYLYRSSGNIIRYNSIFSNNLGIYMFNSDNNVVYLNDIVGNVNNIYLQHSTKNLWNSTSSLTYFYRNVSWVGCVGNFWGDSCSDADGNGICDAIYSVNNSATDYCPLVESFESYQLSMTETGESNPDNVNDTLEQIVSKYNPSFDWTTDTPTKQDVITAVTNAVQQYFSTNDPAVRQEIVDDVIKLVALYFQIS